MPKDNEACCGMYRTIAAKAFMVKCRTTVCRVDEMTNDVAAPTAASGLTALLGVYFCLQGFTLAEDDLVAFYSRPCF